MSEKQLGKLPTAQEREMGWRYVFVSHQHRVGQDRDEIIQGEFAELKTGQA